MTEEQYNHYKEVRSEIQSGDLLLWSTDDTTFLSSIFTRIVRLLTVSDYSHTAIAWVLEGRAYAVDATIPKIKLTLLSECEDFYHIPIKLNLTPLTHTQLTNYIKETYLGKSYSILDGIRGYLGYTNESNDRWQCAELCHNFYEQVGIDLGNAYTPSKLIRAIIRQRDTLIRYIRHG